MTMNSDPNVQPSDRESEDDESVFVIERTLDYVVRQHFAVRAPSLEDALGQLDHFLNASAWTEGDAQDAGVVQISDVMVQVENSQAFYPEMAPVAAAALEPDESMADLIRSNAAAAMRELIQRIPSEALNLSPDEPLPAPVRESLLSIAVEAAALEATIRRTIQKNAEALQAMQALVATAVAPERPGRCESESRG